MAPMISTTSEARNFANMLKEIGLPVHGVMVETPAAVMNAEAILARSTASIGTKRPDPVHHGG